MKAIYGLLATSLCLIFFTSTMSGQITSVNYQMKYDTSTCLYDCYIIVNSGSATTVQQRTQFNAQYSIVVPNDATVTVDTSYMPLVSNATYTGTVPMDWTITGDLTYPSGSPTQRFYSITPTIIPQAHYNDLMAGDTVKLFSLNITPTVNCASDIRIWENGSDPASSDPDMAGADFSNGFTIGGTTQLYNDNSTQLYPPSPIILDVVNECSTGIEIDLSAETSGCQSPLTYAWTGPDSFTSASQDVSIDPATPANTGVYKVVITDGFGCQDSVSVNATAKPDAGSDRTICAGTIDTLSGSNPATGTWQQAAGNPAGASLIQLPAGQAQVTFTGAATGDYNFVYVTPQCTDSMIVSIDSLPGVSINGDDIICVGSTTTLLPDAGGSWVSNNPAVATVTAGGTVTGVTSGTATFTFTDGNGCSNTTSAVTVDPSPTVANTGMDTICIGENTTLTPMTGGTWASTDPAVATITNTGVVTGVAAGTTGMIFTESSTSCVSDTLFITVRPRPTISFVGNDSLCINSTTSLLPSSGGTWASSDPLIATINNSGIVTGVNIGKVVMTFTDAVTQCASDPSDTITVLGQPVVSITGDDRLCVNGMTTLAPTTGGTWTSSDVSVATVDNSGNVTTVGQGSAVFTYVETASGCSNTTSAVIVDPKPTVSVAQSNICIGATTTLNPAAGGTWVAHTPTVASLSGGNIVTGLTADTALFTFVETGTNCESDTVKVVVEPGPVVSISGDDEICVGFTTQLSPMTGGTWTSSDPNIATVNNFGLVTGVAAGTVTFTFTDASTFCVSAPTDPVTVIGRPIVSVSATNVCIGATINASPSVGGTWTSSNPAIATIDNSGLITGVSAGFVTFTFTDATTGCVSEATVPVTVSAIPIVSFTGPNTICVDQTTNVSPSTGGTWVSSDPSIATITNTGVVTAIAAGSTTLIYTATNTTCTANPLTVTINPKPTVSVTGDSPICVGDTSYLAPTTGGAWASTVPGVATVDNSGLVIGQSQGTATFIFTSAAGCPSDESAGIVVNGAPTVSITGDDEVCIGDTTYLAPTNGIWTASDTNLVTIITAGGIIADSAGMVTFTFQDTATGCASTVATDPITINPTPITAISGPASICVGSVTSITPTVGGSWTSVDPAIATVSNSGTITGVAAGSVEFIFTNTATGCISDTSSAVTVTPGPIVSITGDDEICEGETTTLSPTAGGTWMSNDPTVATVTNSGVVTGVGAGNATFVFTETGSGCTSEATDPIIVHGAPTITLVGNDDICIGGTTNFLPSTDGTWTSTDPAVATIDNTGLVTGVTQGTATFIYTLSSTSCPSDESVPIDVSPAPTVSITGPTSICSGGLTTLSPSTGGTWTSSNPAVASVTNDGIVTGIAPGKATFTFVETATGCSSASSTGELTISNCANPDINATFVDVPVDGDVNTNDMVSIGTTYGPAAVLTSSPSGSVATITINSDGTYTFQANTVGVYTYDVPYCIPPQTTGCPVSLLTITVVDHLEPDLRPIANTDIAVTQINTPVTLKSLSNDDCVVVTGCSLDSSSVSITVAASNGTGTVAGDGSGDINYSPNLGFIGKDTLTYEVCVSGDPTNCATAIQIISIFDASADNTTDAADDFASTAELTPVSGDVKLNDTDAEGDDQTVTAQNVSVAAGTLVLGTDGSYTFTPAENFFGPVEFVYETCDDNATQACANATLHILVVPDLSLKVRVYLEGALMNHGNTVGTTHTRPLMRDNLRSSPFNGANYIPVNDPYQVDNLDEGFGTLYTTGLPGRFDHAGPGALSAFAAIPDPSGVFAKTGEDAISDWVFVELRSKTDTSIVATRAGLLQRDADVADLNGERGLRFPGIVMDDYFVVVRHRNHLGAMTSLPQTPQQLTELVDFTDTNVDLYDRGFVDYGFGVTYDFTGLAMKVNPFGLPVRALWAGDFDGNKKIKAANPGDDLNVVFFDVFSHANNTALKANFDFAYGYRNADFDLNAKVKFDNPNDDKNMLFGQLLFYPLNSQFLSNFDFFIEQLPE